MATTEIEASLAALETHQNRPAGDLLFCEGDEPEGIYIIHSGAIDLLFSARDGTGVKSLRTAEAGHSLGLSSIVMHQVHDCSAMTRTKCSLSFVARDDFERALREKPAAWFSILAMLSRDVSAAYDDMRSFSGRSAPRAAQPH